MLPTEVGLGVRPVQQTMSARRRLRIGFDIITPNDFHGAIATAAAADFGKKCAGDLCLWTSRPAARRGDRAQRRRRSNGFASE